MKDQPGDQDDHDYSLTNWRLKELERGRSDADLRLDSLERWKNWVLGGASVLSLAVGAFAKQAWSYLTGHP